MTNSPYQLFILRCKKTRFTYSAHTQQLTALFLAIFDLFCFNKLPPFLNKQPKNVVSLQKKSSTRQFESKLSLRSFAFSLHRQPMKVFREPHRRHLLRPRAVTIDDRRRSSIKTQKVALSGSWQSIKLSFKNLQNYD